MSKFKDVQEFNYRKDGKVMKGENFKRPNLSFLKND